MNAVITIDGRQAIPVRALPYVTDWKAAPDELVFSFCRPVKTLKVRIRSAKGTIPISSRDSLASYALLESGKYRKIKPEEWGFIRVEIDCLTKTLQADERAEGENWAMWRRQATNLLPSTAFVWLDEFQTWFSNTRPLKIIEGDAFEEFPEDEDCTHSSTEHESDKLTLAPIVSVELEGVIFDGFQQQGTHSVTPEKAAQPAADNVPAEEMRKRSALIKELEREWPSIERDLADASRSSDLQSAKVFGRHGYWYLERVKTWGRENGKIAPVQGKNAIQSNDIAGQLRAVKAATRTHKI